MAYWCHSHVEESGPGGLGAKTSASGTSGNRRFSAGEERLGPSGTYLCELTAQPGGPEGRPHTTAGSKPITETGRPRGAQPCSPRLVKCSSHLVPCPVSTSRTHPAAASPLPRLPVPPGPYSFNHARYDGFGKPALANRDQGKRANGRPHREAHMVTRALVLLLLWTAGSVCAAECRFCSGRMQPA